MHRLLTSVIAIVLFCLRLRLRFASRFSRDDL